MTDQTVPSSPRVLAHVAGTMTPLADNAPHQLAAAHALVHFRSGSVYSFIPKNACTTMRVSLALANGFIESDAQWEWVHKNNRSYSASLPQLAAAPYSFVILRCPFRRIASVYLDKIVGKSEDMWSLWQSTGEGFDPDEITFADFLNTVLTAGVMRQNIHWRPQSDFLVYRDYDSYFSVEKFSTANAEISERTGLAIVDARPLSAHGTDRFEEVNEGVFTRTPAREIAALQADGKCPSYAALYTPAVRRQVGLSYSADLALYAARLGVENLLFPSAE